jgi:hypothetical protein
MPCWYRLFLLGLGLVVFAGCGGSGPGLMKVHGTVRYNGAPVTSGTVQFQGQPGQTPELPPGTGIIQSDGTYTVTTVHGPGLVPGKYLVAVVSMESGELESPQPVVKWLVPEKYANPTTSGLSADINSQTAMPLDFDLAP